MTSFWGHFWRWKRENHGLSFSASLIEVLNVAGEREMIHFRVVVIVVFNGGGRKRERIMISFWGSFC